jgi:glucose-1-phosphate adenylyltransferase
MTQYKAHSLVQHIQRGWGYSARRVRRVRRGDPGAAADGQFLVSRHGRLALPEPADHPPAPSAHVLVLAGDHIYKMDYGPMLASHVEKRADITVGVVEVPARAGDCVRRDERRYRLPHHQVRGEAEGAGGHSGREQFALGSMGIYVFKANLLYRLLEEDASARTPNHDFGRNIIPNALDSLKVFAYPFTDSNTRVQHYWRDVGPSTPSTKRTWSWFTSTPSSTIYDEDGRSGPTSVSIRRRSSCSTRKAGAAWR